MDEAEQSNPQLVSSAYGHNVRLKQQFSVFRDFTRQFLAFLPPAPAHNGRAVDAKTL